MLLQRQAATHYLLPRESLEVAVRRHWTVLVRPGLRLGAIAALIVVLLVRTPADSSFVGILLLALAAVLLVFAWQWAGWWTDRFVVTDKRVMLVTGVLTHRVAIMPLSKVTDMTYENSLPGRVLGYGAFIMESAGQDQALHRIDHVAHPDWIYQRMSNLIFPSRPEQRDPRGED